MKKSSPIFSLLFLVLSLLLSACGDPTPTVTAVPTQTPRPATATATAKPATTQAATTSAPATVVPTTAPATTPATATTTATPATTRPVTTVPVAVASTEPTRPSTITLPQLDAKASGLILFDFEGDLWILSLPEGARTRRTNDGPNPKVPQGMNRNPVWSPDSLQIAFASARDVYQQPNYKGGTEIYTMRPDGSQLTRLTQGPEGLYIAKTPVAWLPNGEILIRQTDVTGTANPTGGPVAPLVLLDPVTKKTRTLPIKVTDGNLFPVFGISPDKTQMAYVVGKTDSQTNETKLELYVASLSGADQPKLLATLPPMRLAVVSALVWSPDGQSITVSEAEGDACGSFALYNVSKNGGAPRPVSGPTIGFPQTLSYAPNGKWLTYSVYGCQGQPGTNPKIFLLDTEKGGNALELANGSNPSYGRKITA